MFKLSHLTVKAAQKAVKKSEEFDIRRSLISIAAAVIYIVPHADYCFPGITRATSSGAVSGPISLMNARRSRDDSDP
ncbi:hypothetical protein P3L10_001975 [Capsicum annuum]